MKVGCGQEILLSDHLIVQFPLVIQHLKSLRKKKGKGKRQGEGEGEGEREREGKI